MSEKISDNNDVLKEIKVGSASVPQAEGSCGPSSKNDDGLDFNVRSTNTRKNTVISNRIEASMISGPSIMESEDATTTTIAIGKNTYTIGEPRSKIKLL